MAETKRPRGVIYIVEIGDKENLNSQPNRPPWYLRDVRSRVRGWRYPVPLTGSALSATKTDPKTNAIGYNDAFGYNAAVTSSAENLQGKSHGSSLSR
jgi:hypothetical protein